MKNIMGFFNYIFPLCLLLIGCKGSMVIDSSNQLNYAYSSDSFGYNDIKKLYSSDTVNAKQPFFKSESLQEAEVLLKSHLTKTILKQNTESKLVCYQLTNPSFIIKNEGIITDTEFISEDLVKPVFVQIDNYGKIGHISFDSSMTNMAAGIFKDIIGRMQFVKPIKKSKSWQTVEENSNGVYTANYHISKSNSTGDIYKKELVKYLKYKSKRKNLNIDTDNTTTIETDANGTIKSIYTSEAQIVFYNTDTISASGTKVSVSLTSISKIKNSSKEHLLKIKKTSNYGNQTTLSAPASVERVTKMVHAGTLGSDNWQQLFQRLSASKNLTKEKKDLLIEKFKAIFYLYPDTCNNVVSILEKEPFNSVISVVLRSALSRTETSEATDVIADIITNNKNNEKVLEELLPELTTTAFPTKKAVEVVKSIAFNTEDSQDDFITSTAQLTLGGMAYRFKKNDTLQANNLTKFLMNEMRFEKDTIQKLLVLGNTGSFDIFPYVASLINDDRTSDELKVEAVSALRLIENNQVSAYLRKLLQDESTAIKDMAKEVLEFRKTKFE
ncbi:hypothetical protein [Maribacter sp. HTCC2170]|uniref:hypothetical protein n=1 Tax=Maribacter sp. (strain HTCC2170 / KCCM 42371) TaxID=313603 RepID=UPI00006B4887|nr:hypothetical protein [Maribacter sp. HTCC2170]EAR01995.1 hypothetical protein FB2170_15743 [Maribacter sp. HTCC2170]